LIATTSITESSTKKKEKKEKRTKGKGKGKAVTMAVTEPKDERVHLRYFQWQPIFEKVKPYELLIEVPEGYPMTNFSITPAEDAETIHDLRSSELSSFTLDQHGFCVREQPLSITVFDKHTVEGVYLPQIESLIREVVEDVGEVFFFDWRVGFIFIFMDVFNNPTSISTITFFFLFCSSYPFFLSNPEKT
jgi:hypothetical protein